MGYRSICAIVCCVIFSACKPKYFEIIEDQVIMEQLAPRYDLKSFEHYRFMLRSAQYFKNNTLTSTLVSDSSQFIKFGRLFTTSPATFNYDDAYSYIDSSWFAIDAYVERTSDQDTQSVYIKTLSGKNYSAADRRWMEQHGEKVKTSAAKLSNIYLGYIDPSFSDEKDKSRRMVIIDQAYKISYNKVEVLKKEPALAFLLKQLDETLVIEAVIDINYRKKEDRPVIYNMEALFGESLWMNKVGNDTEYK